MSFDANSQININTDKFSSFNKKKDLNILKNETYKSENFSEINSNEKYSPVKDINSVDSKFIRRSSFHPGLFQDLFADNDVDKAKALVKEIVNSADKGKFADNVREFYKLINKMDNHELVETAEFLGEQMRSTDGRDDLFGSLLMGVLSELRSRNNQPIYIRDVLNAHRDELIKIKEKNLMPQLKFVEI